MSVCICVYILVCVSLWECCKGVWVCVCVERQSLRWKRLEHIPKLRRRSGGERVSKKRVLLTLRTLLEFRWFSNWIFLSSTHSDCVYHLPNYCPYLSCSRPSSFICSFTGMKVKVLVTQSCLTLWHPKDYSPPGSSVQGILQARIMQWFASPILPTQGSNPALLHCRQILYHLSQRGSPPVGMDLEKYFIVRKNMWVS